MSNYPSGMIFDNEDASEAKMQAERLKFARRLGRMAALTDKLYQRHGQILDSWRSAHNVLEKQCETLGFLSYDADGLEGYIIAPDCVESYQAGYLSVPQPDPDTAFDWGWD